MPTVKNVIKNVGVRQWFEQWSQQEMEAVDFYDQQNFPPKRLDESCCCNWKLRWKCFQIKYLWWRGSWKLSQSPNGSLTGLSHHHQPIKYPLYNNQQRNLNSRLDLIGSQTQNYSTKQKLEHLVHLWEREFSIMIIHQWVEYQWLTKLTVPFPFED